jgi:Uma2 family endonuclease
VTPECGGQTQVTDDEMISGAAELVVEVAYSSANIDLHRKRDDYDAAGVREYIVALVETNAVVRFARRRGRLAERPADPDGIIRSTVFPGLWLDPAALFAPDTRRLTAVLREGLATAEHAAFVAKLEAKRASLARRRPRRDSE